MSYNSTGNNQKDASIGFRFDNCSFEAFFKKHYPQLCVYCKFKYNFDIELAEDVVNTSFIKLWEARQSLATGISPKSYLYKIINNNSLNVLKHEKIKQQYAHELLKTTCVSIEQNSFDSVDLKQLRRDIDAAVSEFPEQMRRIFELSRFEGLKYSEISSLLNISVKTVETQIGRALAKLRERLSGYLTLYITALLLSF